MRLLIVENEITVRQLLVDRLERDGVTVTVAPTVTDAVNELNSADFDIAILALHLPDGSGFDVLRVLREREPSAHVIIVSRCGTEADRIRGLDFGADDYVVRPYCVDEVVARVGAVRRRQTTGEQVFDFGCIKIDVVARRVMVDGAPVTLSAKEFDLLTFMAARPRRVFRRDELLRSVWRSSSEFQQAATVTEHIWRLRSKIERDPHRPLVLQTVRGIGYRFEPPAQG